MYYSKEEEILLVIIVTILLLIGFPLIEGKIYQINNIFNLFKYLIEVVAIVSVLYVLIRLKKKVYIGLFIFIIGFFLMTINNIILGNDDFILEYIGIYDYLVLIIIGIIYLASIYLIRKRFQEY